MLLVVQEVVQTPTGQLDVHLETTVVYRLEHGVETLQWLLTKKVGQVTGTVTVLVRLQVENHQVLHSYQQTVLKLKWNSVGHVAVVGLLLMLLVVKVLCLHTVVVVADKGVKVALVSCELLTSRNLNRNG